MIQRLRSKSAVPRLCGARGPPNPGPPPPEYDDDDNEGQEGIHDNGEENSRLPSKRFRAWYLAASKFAVHFACLLLGQLISHTNPNMSFLLKDCIHSLEIS